MIYIKRFLRALNTYDILSNPSMNGIGSKKLIYDITKLYLENNEANYLNNLSSIEREQYIKDYMITYLKNNQDSNKLRKKYYKNTRNIKNIIDGALRGNTNDYIMFLTYLSSLNNHLINGSRVDTEWISSSTSLSAIYKYYSNQDIHKVALIESNTNGLFDDYTFFIALHDKRFIKLFNNILVKKIDYNTALKLADLSKYFPFIYEDFKLDYVETTNEKFMGYNFSVKDRQFCTYQYIPDDKIVNVLGQLEMDLIYSGIIDSSIYLKLSREEQIEILGKIRYFIEYSIRKSHDNYPNYVYNELYLNDKDIKVVSSNIFERDKMDNERAKILRLAKKCPFIINSDLKGKRN